MPSELQAAVLACLSPNEQACVGRLVSRNTCRLLSNNRTARFGLPLPPSAGTAAWQPHLRQAFKELSFDNKLGMLLAAAASGSEANLQLAWGLLRPCLHPELLQRPQGFRERVYYHCRGDLRDPGTAAVRAGHAAAVLPWLVDHGCPLHPHKTLEAAAQHCDLAGLQAAWQLLGCGNGPLENWEGIELFLSLARTAGLSGGLSGGRPAIAKLAWLFSLAPALLLRHHRTELLVRAAVGAASSGSLPVLAWLQGEGLDLPSTRLDNLKLMAVTIWKAQPWKLAAVENVWAVVVGAALQGGHVAVADWLVDEAGCPLPREEEVHALNHVWLAAADGGHVEALRWLLGRGVPVGEPSARQAASAGRLEALRFLHTECGAVLTKELFVEAASSRSLPTAAWLLQAGCPMDPQAYIRAAQEGDADMVVWLAQEARCPWGDGTLALVINECPDEQQGAARRGLQRAVRVLEEAGCPPLEARSGEAREALDVAARRGDLVLLRRLHGELGVGLAGGTLAAAAEGGCEAVVEWLVGQGCAPGEEEGRRPVRQGGPQR